MKIKALSQILRKCVESQLSMPESFCIVSGRRPRRRADSYVKCLKQGSFTMRPTFNKCRRGDRPFIGGRDREPGVESGATSTH